MNVGIDSLRKSLAEFDSKHKRPLMADLTSLLEVLTLEEGMWPSYWTNGGLLRRYADEPCVYVFFDHSGEMLYIGQTKCLGNRFGAHLSKGGLGKEKAGSIAFIPVPRECWFEILAIEGYLIDKLILHKNKPA